MKFLKFMLVALVAITATQFAGAQGKITYLQTNQYKLFPYVRTSTLVTTDDTARTIDALALSNNEGGILEVSVVGIDTADVAFVTGVKTVRYGVKSGVVTVTTGNTTSTLVTSADTAISGATFSISSSGTSILVQVTGVAAKRIKWAAYMRRIYVTKTAVSP